MHYDPELHHRRTIRLRGYDYRQAGVYFLTLCAYQRAVLFGEIVDGEMRLNACGHIVMDEWMETAMIRSEIMRDEFIMMPNHFHAIVMLRENNEHQSATAPRIVGAHCRAPGFLRAPKSLGSLVAGFKSSVTKRINHLRDRPGVPVWQRNYYEHIIRDGAALQRIREYIANNPATWTEDNEHPDRIFREQNRHMEGHILPRRRPVCPISFDSHIRSQFRPVSGRLPVILRR